MKKIIIGVIIAIGLFASQTLYAQGTIYVSNMGQPSTGSEAVGSDSWLAIGFQTGNNSSGYIINSIQLGMLDATDNLSSFTAMIYLLGNPGGDTPGSSLGTLIGSLDPATAGIYTYTLSFNHTFLPDNDYFIVLTSGTIVANGAYESSLGPAHSYNRSGGWSNEGTFTSIDGSSWSFVSGIYPEYSITATPVPEPSPSLLLLLGSGIFIYVLRTKLRRTETTETDGIICPLRIAEIRRAAGECVGLRWLPIKEIRARFNYDGNIRGPRDGETEIVCLHAKIRFEI